MDLPLYVNAAVVYDFQRIKKLSVSRECVSLNLDA